MKIQVLTYSKKHDSDGIVYNTFNRPRSLDEFDINFVDLGNREIWKSENDSRKSTNVRDDLISLNTMVSSSGKSKFIFMLPRNELFEYCYSNAYGEYRKSTELKNMICDFKTILSMVYKPLADQTIVYEPTKTKVGQKEIKGDFYFGGYVEKITESIDSAKITTIKHKGIFITTLRLENTEDIKSFIVKIGLADLKQQIPKWVKEIKMFDDQKQLDIIAKNNQVIREANDKISDAMTIIDKNNEYKSILYTSGDELVQVVFEILEEMLGCDLSNFKDEKKEDFLFELDGKVYIGEIKGVNHNVKSENVSQLEVHYQGYMDDHQDVAIDNIKALLIMNHQKNKPLDSREKVHDTQINLARRNGSLIVETNTLLKLFERYKGGLLSRQDCIDTLINSSGLLII